MVNNEVTVAFSGNKRETLQGFVYPEPPVIKKVTFDAVIGRSGLVPFQYKAGQVIFVQMEHETMADKPVLDLVFNIFGTPEESETALMAIKGYGVTLAKYIDFYVYHVASRLLYSDNPKYAQGQKVPRFLLLRIYKNADFECVEHPEMLVGKPLGMYHCPVCGEMQVAGIFHLPKGEQYNV